MAARVVFLARGETRDGGEPERPQVAPVEVPATSVWHPANTHSGLSLAALDNPQPAATEGLVTPTSEGTPTTKHHVIVGTFLHRILPSSTSYPLDTDSVLADLTSQLTLALIVQPAFAARKHFNTDFTAFKEKQLVVLLTTLAVLRTIPTTYFDDGTRLQFDKLIATLDVRRPNKTTGIIPVILDTIASFFAVAEPPSASRKAYLKLAWRLKYTFRDLVYLLRSAVAATPSLFDNAQLILPHFIEGHNRRLSTLSPGFELSEVLITLHGELVHLLPLHADATSFFTTLTKPLFTLYFAFPLSKNNSRHPRAHVRFFIARLSKRLRDTLAVYKLYIYKHRSAIGRAEIAHIDLLVDILQYYLDYVLTVYASTAHTVCDALRRKFGARMKQCVLNVRMERMPGFLKEWVFWAVEKMVGLDAFVGEEHRKKGAACGEEGGVVDVTKWEKTLMGVDVGIVHEMLKDLSDFSDDRNRIVEQIMDWLIPLVHYTSNATISDDAPLIEAPHDRAAVSMRFRLKVWAIRTLGKLGYKRNEIYLHLIALFNAPQYFIRTEAARALANQALNYAAHDDDEVIKVSSQTYIIHDAYECSCKLNGPDTKSPARIHFKNPYRLLLRALDDVFAQADTVYVPEGTAAAVNETFLAQTKQQQFRTWREAQAFGLWAYYIARHVVHDCSILSPVDKFAAQLFHKVAHYLAKRLDGGETDFVRRTVAMIAVGALQGASNAGVRRFDAEIKLSLGPVVRCAMVPRNETMKCFEDVLWRLRKSKDEPVRLIIVWWLYSCLAANLEFFPFRRLVNILTGYKVNMSDKLGPNSKIRQSEFLIDDVDDKSAEIKALMMRIINDDDFKVLLRKSFGDAVVTEHIVPARTERTEVLEVASAEGNDFSYTAGGNLSTANIKQKQQDAPLDEMKRALDKENVTVHRILEDHMRNVEKIERLAQELVIETENELLIDATRAAASPDKTPAKGKTPPGTPRRPIVIPDDAGTPLVEVSLHSTKEFAFLDSMLDKRRKTRTPPAKRAILVPDGDRVVEIPMKENESFLDAIIDESQRALSEQTRELGDEVFSPRRATPRVFVRDDDKVIGLRFAASATTSEKKDERDPRRSRDTQTRNSPGVSRSVQAESTRYGGVSMVDTSASPVDFSWSVSEVNQSRVNRSRVSSSRRKRDILVDSSEGEEIDMHAKSRSSASAAEESADDVEDDEQEQDETSRRSSPKKPAQRLSLTSLVLQQGGLTPIMINGPIRVKLDKITGSLIYGREKESIDYFENYRVVVPKKSKRKVRGHAPVREGLHPVLRKVFELDPTIFIELCESLDMTELMDFDDKVKWICGLIHVHNHLLPLSQKVYKIEGAAKGRAVSLAQAMVVVKDYLSIGRKYADDQQTRQSLLALNTQDQGGVAVGDRRGSIVFGSGGNVNAAAASRAINSSFFGWVNAV